MALESSCHVGRHCRPMARGRCRSGTCPLLNRSSNVWVGPNQSTLHSSYGHEVYRDPLKRSLAEYKISVVLVNYN